MNPAPQAACLDALRTRLGAAALRTERADLQPYEQGWRYGSGRAFAAALPATPEDVAAVLAVCAEHGVRVQPIGANTGLVGASNPDPSGEQLVLSLERLNRSIDVDPVDAVAVVDAGVRLSELDAALRPHGLWFPIDLGADPQLGGMVATNTGGTRLVRYGDLRRNLLGLEVALADGRLVSRLRRLRKDNTGLDLKQLFVGTSGTFGVVTRAVVQLAPRPAQTATAFVALRDGRAALDLLAALGRAAGDALTAFEVLSATALEITLRRGANLRPPFPDGAVPAYSALVELATTFPAARLDLPALLEETLVEHAGSDPRQGVTDVAVGRGADFWAIRHQITESLRAEGRVLAFDVAVPRARLARFTEVVRQRVAAAHPFVRLCDYGHWGDGGTHLNLLWDEAATPADAGAFWRGLRELIYDTAVREFDGSFSAEHGVGPHNAEFYRRYGDETQRAASRSLKRLFDPDGRLGTVDLG